MIVMLLFATADFLGISRESDFDGIETEYTIRRMIQKGKYCLAQCPSRETLRMIRIFCHLARSKSFPIVSL
jgi:hypothetical protein